jgi:hypothetical protein
MTRPIATGATIVAVAGLTPPRHHIPAPRKEHTMPASDDRITVGLNRRTRHQLDAMTVATGLSKTDLVDQGIRLRHLAEYVTRNGARLAIINPDGSVERVHLV